MASVYLITIGYGETVGIFDSYELAQQTAIEVYKNWDCKKEVNVFVYEMNKIMYQQRPRKEFVIEAKKNDKMYALCI